MAKNIFNDHSQAVLHKGLTPPPLVRPQNWGDKTPQSVDLKQQILADVQKTVVVGDVTKIDKS